VLNNLAGLASISYEALESGVLLLVNESGMALRGGRGDNRGSRKGETPHPPTGWVKQRLD